MYFDVLETNNNSPGLHYAHFMTTQRHETWVSDLWDYKRIKLFQLLQILVCDFHGLSEGWCKHGKVAF